MCGISGYLNSGGEPADPEVTKRMIQTIRHRGPDGWGVDADREVSLGHARLSIIDLEGGSQPMWTPGRALGITYNGEIFNYIELREELRRKGYRFATQSDTEVLLHLYNEEGPSCVDRLNGQWAFAIWDARRRRLFLSRDRLGVRPLYYTQSGRSLYFASEIKALLASGAVEPELDLKALDQIFTFWTPLPPRTSFRYIRQLPPGHSLVAENGAVRTWQYWSIDYCPEDAGGCESDLSEELLELLTDATRIRLRADVPVGAYLSGGLDSTVVTALAKRIAGNRLRSFSVTFDDAAFDESTYQQQASDYLQTDHSSVRCTPEDIARVFPDVIWSTEQPVLRTAPAPLYLLSQHVRQSGFKVVLTGEGADEVLGGYDIFKETKIRDFWRRQPDSRMRPLLLKRLYPYLDTLQQQPLSYLQRFFHVNGGPADPYFSHRPRWELTAKTKLFFSSRVQDALRGVEPTAPLSEALPGSYSGWNPFLQAQFLETAHLLPGYILSAQGDRVAMAHGVEGRFPFLDHRVVTFAARLPVTLKMRVLREKYLLKRCAEGLIPPQVQWRNKQPYRAPDGACFLTATARDYMETVLADDCLRRHDIFAPKAVRRLLQKFQSGSAIGAKDNMALVGIVSTQLLLHQFFDNPTKRVS